MVNRWGRHGRWVPLIALAATFFVLAACSSTVSDEAKRDLEVKMTESALTIYPVGVLRGTETGTAPAEVGMLVQGLAGAGFREIVPVRQGPNIRLVWKSNHKAMLAQVAKQVREYVKANPIQTDYALYGQYLLRQMDDGESVVGVHWVIADKAGRIAETGIVDSSDPLFVEKHRRVREACTPVLLDSVKHSLGGMLAKAGKTQAGG